MTQASTMARLSDAQLQEVVQLIKGADSVELKLTIPESDQRSAVAALDMDPLEAQIRQVFFLDTPDLDLNQRGLVVRARRVQGKGDDSVVKRRPVDPHRPPAEVRAYIQLRVEVDAMPGGFVCSGSMKASFGSTDVREPVAGDRPLRKPSPRNSGPSTRHTHPRAWHWTTSLCWGRSSC